MRTIDPAAAFKRDCKRAKASPRHWQDLGRLVSGVEVPMMADQDLSQHYRDHVLVGDWSGCCEYTSNLISS